MDIELLLTHADDHRPVLEDGLSLETAAHAPKPPPPAPPRILRNDSREPNDLSLQRWGIIAPAGPAGDRLLELIKPLRRAREEAQDAPAHVYRVPGNMTLHQAIEWKDTVYWDEGMSVAELPRYLLILGDLDEVPLVLQQAMATDTFVGRLALDSDQDYLAYVEKVQRWEAEEAKRDESRVVCCTVRDRTPANEIGDSALMVPTVSALREHQSSGFLPLGDVVELGRERPSMSEFLEAVAQPGPSMLFTISHGLGQPRRGWRSVAEQHALQGAMSFGGDGYLAAGDVAGRPFLPGGIWFFLACYGGATPPVSSYYAWLKKLQALDMFPGRVESVLTGLPRAGERPFAAALPKSVLANPEGALAIIAHADLAWTYGYQDIRMQGSRPIVRDRPSRFQGVFRSLLQGCRAGVAYYELLRYFGEANAELTTLYQEEAQDTGTKDTALADERARAIHKASLFMLRNDLAGYLLLGDPAVRLPLRLQSHCSSMSVDRAASLLGMSRVLPGAADGDMPSVREIEEAVLAMLRGKDGERALATQLGVTRDELVRWLQVYKAAGRAALERLRR